MDAIGQYTRQEGAEECFMRVDSRKLLTAGLASREQSDELVYEIGVVVVVDRRAPTRWFLR